MAMRDVTFLVGKGASGARTDLDHAEERRRDPHRMGPLGDAIHIEGWIESVEERLRFERRDISQPVEQVRHRCSGTFDAGLRIAVEHEHNPIGLGNVERPQQHLANDREQRRIGGNAERQGRARRERVRAGCGEATAGPTGRPAAARPRRRPPAPLEPAP